VRELRNAVHRAYVMADGDTIDTQWLPALEDIDSDWAPLPPAKPLPLPGIAAALPAPHPGEAAAAQDDEDFASAPGAGITALNPNAPPIVLPVGASMAQAERLLIQATLHQCEQQKERTAAVLGISL